jgi:hypothetical protein
VEIAPEVIQYFRDVNLIRQLKSPVPIEVLNEEFHGRHEYLQHIIAAIRARTEMPGIILLDPDTGLQPLIAEPDFKHVLNVELKAIWGFLSVGDVLVLYQHKTAMNNEPFIEPKIRQFVEAIGISRERAKYAYAPRIARDVAFLFAQKE